jgi:hypothetical protein
MWLRRFAGLNCVLVPTSWWRFSFGSATSTAPWIQSSMHTSTGWWSFSNSFLLSFFVQIFTELPSETDLGENPNTDKLSPQLLNETWKFIKNLKAFPVLVSFSFKQFSTKSFQKLKVERKPLITFVQVKHRSTKANFHYINWTFTFPSTETSETHSRTLFNHSFHASSKRVCTMQMFTTFSEELIDKTELIMIANKRTINRLWRLLLTS